VFRSPNADSADRNQRRFSAIPANMGRQQLALSPNDLGRPKAKNVYASVESLLLARIEILHDVNEVHKSAIPTIVLRERVRMP
jgi:hypothetical protein